MFPTEEAAPPMTSETVRCEDDLPLTVTALVHRRAEQYGTKRLVVCDDESLTYVEAERDSAELARGLLAVGAGKGTRVGLLFPNTPAFVVSWLAATRIGAVAVPLSTFSTAVELADLLRRADVDMLLSARSFRSHDYVETLGRAIPELDLGAPAPLWSTTVPSLRRVFVSDIHGDDAVVDDWQLDELRRRAGEVDDDVLAAVEAEVSPADPMVVVHTSGSTSAPKGVVHGQGPLLRHQQNLNERRHFTDDEILFANSPWFWIGGFAYALLGSMVAGGGLVCSNASDAATVLDVLERERPTMTNGFAASVAHIPDDPTFAGRDLSSMRRGNLYPIMPADARPADPGLRYNMLGMTEAGGVCLGTEDETELPEERRGSFGGPVTGLESRIVDPDTGVACAPGEVGVLQLRGPFLMEGYLGRERLEVFDADQWYPTGDLFHVDDAGHHYFHGRAGDMIKTGGANVSPREVEGVIAEHAGLRSHVLGIDDPTKGQVVAAALLSDDDVDLEQLRTMLRDHLSAYKVPRRYLVLADDEVPMMSSGKLDARALKDRFDGA
ncbi:MAG: class I adenylate-forming enzyme family protein [Acidimicrobiales bacterium]|nr:class I adenylate-forming enzyme family protein [Acidimicrobiales bacterium]